MVNGNSDAFMLLKIRPLDVSCKTLKQVPKILKHVLRSSEHFDIKIIIGPTPKPTLGSCAKCWERLNFKFYSSKELI